MRIGYIVGSLAQNSINRRLARALSTLAPEGVEFFEIGIERTKERIVERSAR